MITVKCFAQVREVAGESQVTLPVSPNMTMRDVIACLVERSEKWSQAINDGVLMACNQTLVDANHVVNDGDEVAFFPPVTGG